MPEFLGEAGASQVPCSGPHLSMCATRDGPYQSPAFLPELCPSSTSRCRPKGAWGWSANHDTICRCRRSCCSSGVPWAPRGGIQRGGARYRLGEANPDGSERPRPEPSDQVQSGGDGAHSQIGGGGGGERGTLPTGSCFTYDSNPCLAPGLVYQRFSHSGNLQIVTPPKLTNCHAPPNFAQHLTEA